MARTYNRTYDGFMIIKDNDEYGIAIVQAPTAPYDGSDGWVDTDINNLSIGSWWIDYTTGDAYRKIADTNNSIDDWVEAGSGEELDYIRAFIGKLTEGNVLPHYTEENFITSGDSLRVAVDTLDIELFDIYEAVGLLSTEGSGDLGNYYTESNYISGITVVEDLDLLDLELKDAWDAISAIQTGQQYKGKAYIVTSDTILSGVTTATVASLGLPFDDDEGTTIDTLSIGDIVVYTGSGSSGGDADVFEVYDNGGTLTIGNYTDSNTFFTSGVAIGDTWYTPNDLPDTPEGQETSAFYTYNGSFFVKTGDMDWQFADGIDMNSPFTASNGTVTANDTVQSAIETLYGNQNNINNILGGSAIFSHSNSNLGNTTTYITSNEDLLQIVGDIDNRISGIVSQAGLATTGVNPTTIDSTATFTYESTQDAPGGSNTQADDLKEAIDNVATVVDKINTTRTTTGLSTNSNWQTVSNVQITLAAGEVGKYEWDVTIYENNGAAIGACRLTWVASRVGSTAPIIDFHRDYIIRARTDSVTFRYQAVADLAATGSGTIDLQVRIRGTAAGTFNVEVETKKILHQSYS